MYLEEVNSSAPTEGSKRTNKWYIEGEGIDIMEEEQAEQKVGDTEDVMIDQQVEKEILEVGEG